MKFITIEKARKMEDFAAVFSSPAETTTEQDWMLTNSKLTKEDKHKDSDEFVKAVKDLAKAQNTISRILGGKV